MGHDHGWGHDSWGDGRWAVHPETTHGGSLPVTSGFDLFCVGACEDMPDFLLYDGVQAVASGAQITTPGFVVAVESGVLTSTDTAWVHVDVGVPSAWTYDFRVRFDSLPNNFGDLANSHVYFGAVDHQGVSAGLFFSKIGVGYTGSVIHDAISPYLLHLNTPFQIVPNSMGVIQEGVEYLIRIAVDHTQGITFVYVTEAARVSLTGHCLLAILPTILSSGSIGPVLDGAYLSVKGNSANSSKASIFSICMGTGLIIPNLPPVADAGSDQSVRICSVVRLDGSGSFDPEMASLSYSWRLTDGPTPSQFVFEADDGATPPEVGLTNKFYSESLGRHHSLPGAEIVVGDILRVQGKAFSIVSVGFEPGGDFFVLVDEHSLQPDMLARTFKVLKQKSISGPTTAKPTFYPDVNGLFRFELRVFDGIYWSAPSNVVVNVMTSVVPRGCIPDVSFLWDYISNFWQLVDNKAHIETFWGAAAQIAATEMLTLWQTEYNKSLRDIQNTFQRRWLHYDLLVHSTNIYIGSVSSKEVIAGKGIAFEKNIFLVDQSLVGADIVEDDLLVVGGEAYRIHSIVDVATDPERYQRVVLKDPMVNLLSGLTWCIGRGSTASLDFYGNLFTEGDFVNFEVEDTETGLVTKETEIIIGVSAVTPNVIVHTQENIREYLKDPARYAVRVESAHRRQYIPITDLVVSIPHLQERINRPDEQEILRENIDYFLETFRGVKCVRFVVGDSDVWQNSIPPTRMWAETTFLDNRPTIEANFGIPADFTLEDLSKIQSNVDYLSAVRGVWYTHFWGPTVRNLRIGTQIFLGLPFSEKLGIIEEIRADFGSSRGRILVRDVHDSEIVRFYTYPNVLRLEVNPRTGVPYKVGDLVEEFAPLVAGVELLDYVNNPDWFAGYLNQGVFYEPEKFFKFLVRVDSAAFSLSSLLFARSFLLRVKPTYTFPMFVVLHHIDSDPIDVQDRVDLHGRLRLHDDICRRAYGASMTYDDWRAAGGGYASAYDSGKPFAADPEYNIPYDPIHWGYDKELLCPNDCAYMVLSHTFSDKTYPCYDGIFSYDSFVITDMQGPCDFPQLDFIPTGGDLLWSSQTVCTKKAQVSGIGIIVRAMGPFSETSPLEGLTLELWVNGVLITDTRVDSVFSGEGGAEWFPFVHLLSLSVNDVIQFTIRSGAGVSIPWTCIAAWLGNQYLWSYDSLLPPQTYYTVRVL